MKGFYQTYLDMFETIEEAIAKRRIVPCLVLIYSTIDSFSFLAERNPQRKGERVFRDWVKKWMLEKYPLPCNEVDIYSARCGLVHDQISESSNLKNNKAVEIYYSWGDSNVDALQFAIDKINKKAIAVKVEDLHWSLRNGLADCKEEIEKDESWKKCFEEKAKKLFVNIAS